MIYRKYNCLVWFLYLMQQNVFTNDIYSIYMYKKDLALNNLQWLIFH